MKGLRTTYLVSLILVVLSCLNIDQLVLADAGAAPVIIVDYHMSTSGQIETHSSPDISVEPSDQFDLIIRYDEGAASSNLLRVVIPEGLHKIDSAPAPSDSTQYTMSYKTPDGALDVNIVAIRLEADATLPEGQLTIATFLQSDNANYSNYPLAYQYSRVIIKSTNTIAAIASSTSTWGFSVSTWMLAGIIAILAIALIAFWILPSLVSLPKGHTYPSAIIPAMSDTDNSKTAVLGFSFGLRGIEPGLSNEVMAEVIKASYPDALISVQWEIGNALHKIGIEAAHRVSKHLTQPGKYLDTEEVAKQMADFLSHQADITNVQVIAHDEHMSRVLKTLKKFGIHGKPGCAHIPYDPKSLQIWTRSPLLFKIRELMAWPFYLLKGVA